MITLRSVFYETYASKTLSLSFNYEFLHTCIQYDTVHRPLLIQTDQALDVMLPNIKLHSNTLKCIFNKTL